MSERQGRSTQLRQRVREYFAELQDRISGQLEELDGHATFREDRWDYGSDGRPGAGGGVTRVISGGALFEKGGVNRSDVEGRLNERIAGRLGVDERTFFAGGVSLVLHPSSPMVPTVHMNVRYFELPPEGGLAGKAWFGGGADLTPYYLNAEDAHHFHRELKRACDAHDASYYPRFKQDCDRYFRIAHRNEARGVGGIFFDYLQADPERDFAFVRDVGDAFLPAYLPIARCRRDDLWGEHEKRWQSIRRGRYVEFNLVYDRGTLFGLETGGRIESILMSLPPVVHWAYDHHPEVGSREAALLEVLREPRDWG